MKSAALIALLLAASPAFAQNSEPAGAPDVAQPTRAATGKEPKVNQLIVYGDDPCPRSTNEEIIVCARKSERERYRIPENLRDLGNPKIQAWANNATELSYVGRTGTDSCSTVGGGGFTGCLGQIINAAKADRENRDEVDWNALIADARAARVGTIDADSAEIEREEVAREKANAPK